MTSLREAREIGARIAQARRAKGLSQEALGKKIGLKGKDPARSVQYYESGERVPFNRMTMIAKATDVTRDWLLRGPVDETQLDRIEGKLDQLVAGLLRPPDEEQSTPRVPKTPPRPPDMQHRKASDEHPKRRRKAS